jgi:hypothetical protein
MIEATMMLEVCIGFAVPDAKVEQIKAVADAIGADYLYTA